MRVLEQRPHDPFARNFRVDTLRAGVWPTVLICLFCLGYTFLTWDGPHRLALILTMVAALVSAWGVARGPVEAIVLGRWC